MTSSTRLETRKLFPKCTCKWQKYEDKGEKIITLPEYSNIYVTSNNKNGPLHITHEDRRQLIIEVSDVHKQDREFFGRVISDCRHFDVGHAWYIFLRDRDIGDFHPSQDPPTTVKERTIASCAVKSVIFMNTFFCDEDWLVRYKPHEMYIINWTKLYEVVVETKGDYKGQVRIRVEAARLYTLYTRFMKCTFPSSNKRNSPTFYNELAKVGIIKHEKRRRINEKQKTCVDIYFSVFKEKMALIYPALQVNDWDSELETQSFLKTVKGFQSIPTF